eukprot:jgi/Bigna1/130622/aug1.12_g5330
MISFLVFALTAQGTQGFNRKGANSLQGRENSTSRTFGRDWYFEEGDVVEDLKRECVDIEGFCEMKVTATLDRASPDMEQPDPLKVAAYKYDGLFFMFMSVYVLSANSLCTRSLKTLLIESPPPLFCNVFKFGFAWVESKGEIVGTWKYISRNGSDKGRGKRFDQKLGQAVYTVVAKVEKPLLCGSPLAMIWNDFAPPKLVNDSTVVQLAYKDLADQYDIASHDRSKNKLNKMKVKYYREMSESNKEKYCAEDILMCPNALQLKKMMTPIHNTMGKKIYRNFGQEALNTLNVVLTLERWYSNFAGKKQ